MTFAIRSFDAFHLFWIPVLPLGFWTRWHCTECQAHPHEAVGTTRWVRWFVAAFFLLLAALFWIGAITTDGTRGGDMWIAAGVTTILSVLTVAWAKKAKAVSYKDLRAQVRSFDGATCPLCDGHVVKSLEGESCQQCHAEHRPLEASAEAVHSS